MLPFLTSWWDEVYAGITVYYFWSSGITVRMRLDDLAMLGGFGQGGRLMRIARLERDGRAGAGEEMEVVGCVAVIVAESYRRYLDSKKEEQESERDLTLENVWIR
jgi:hypothetical protein